MPKKMPPSSKRSQRVRREVTHEPREDSSPSRPAKRRKKFDDPVPKQNAVPLPADRSGLAMDDEELVSVVVPFLNMPEDFVQASQDHANTLHEKHSKEGVQAYAKLAGKDWTFYVKTLRNNIGRPPEGANVLPASKGSPTGSLDEEAEENRVHVDLGPSKVVSRLHAQISFDSYTETWNIAVTGRNGIRVDNLFLRRGDGRVLISGQVIEIGGVEMMFVLPQDNGGLQVDKRYLERAGLIHADGDGIQTQDSGPLSSTATILQTPPRGQLGAVNPLPIAPAPPDYRRPETPLGPRSQAPFSAGRSPGYANGGTLLMNADDIDLSLDSNQHIKPTYSYAQMISQAILDTEDEKLNLNGIYNYIMEKYSYYRHQLGGGWQNSIRHNLSLNRAFHKVARSTDEPGKGMKWCIVPESRDEMARNCQRGGRGGHRGSSAPGSPSGLGYLSRATKETLGDLGSAQRLKHQSREDSPPLSSYPPLPPQQTPDRGGKLSAPSRGEVAAEGSPLPRHRRPTSNMFGISDNVPGSPPILSSSYLQDDGNSFATPAPARVHPRLAPPSTAQRPSQHMPTSSPAPFWKYADLGLTPLKASNFDTSPVKYPATPAIPQSSSPAPARAMASPSRNVPGSKKDSALDPDDLDDDDKGFDLTRGFQSIGSYHAPGKNSLAISGSANGRA